jgi:hypothetical protein
MGFMSLEIESGIWFRVEDDGGSGAILPGDLLFIGPKMEHRIKLAAPKGIKLSQKSIAALADYRPEGIGPIVSGEAIKGTAWRLSASGYMDATDWTLADEDDEDVAFREACDAHEDMCVECGATDSTGEREDGFPFCLSCVKSNPDVVDTALSDTGEHDVTDGKAWLVRFGDFGDVIVSARYTEADKDTAFDIACDLMAERRPEWFLDVASGERKASMSNPF